MADKQEQQVEIQVDVPLTDKDKQKCSQDLIAAMNLQNEAMVDLADYIKQKKEEIEKYNDVVSKNRDRINSVVNPPSAHVKLEYTMLIVGALNEISKIEDDVRSYQTEKKAELAKYQAIMNLARSKINRGKDTIKVMCTMVKDFKAKTKTYVRCDTSEVVNTLPLLDEEMQMELVP